MVTGNAHITVDVFNHRYRYTNGLFRICGIVKNVFDHNGYTYVVLRYRGEAMIMLDLLGSFRKYDIGNAVIVECAHDPSKDEDIRTICNYIDETIYPTTTTYKTVKKWQGPKIGGWEDLLK